MTFAIRSSDHTGITVRDLDRSVAFWHDVLGFEIERRAHLTGSFAADVTGVPGATGVPEVVDRLPQVLPAGQ